ncbi:uncharacterized protein LOC100846158 [Brachypodium distachyon]|uniref:F-box domain-containing protein n=1 Tax=Brachypodium distachyon TaxID=15368 RepID=I1IGJ0_BRADI|nr:uncharacterized protein LOC100846158 [Brachypodium distachyon]XP_010237034.1 uncharacterized protein LOC100846158 [Brachypodium distachyon]XP_010237035.1 uncharacterized protein LOC100846158 [Brachypodium distachyon]XP_010237036.1 uncharacterized protein LOC100846158 [Brachypodium distachyon]XP_010237037.1 uncharacterized protein LOC100846158 [Brachypodium distachyon]XP_010237038.1 uncharacterized protein LOC100846158 [Brachypodium distachyon]XP_014758387.1 uncharacterized protein LOC10084|eukprot:XP_003579153.1 uncharacterized protein LOC100846158 [Brachypodium distachyon]
MSNTLHRGQAAPLDDDDDLLSSILLRLPPLPSSLPRAALVCSRWRRLVSDPAFPLRFRLHHRRDPAPAPLIGFFDTYHGVSFQPSMDAPDRVPRGRFSLRIDDRYRSLEWRHGLGLFHLPIPRQVLVWDPVSGAQRRVAVPAGFHQTMGLQICAAVVRAPAAAGDDALRFQVVFVGSGEPHTRTALACVYSSETGAVSDFVSAPLAYSGDPISFTGMPAVLIGGSLCWLVAAGPPSILEFDLYRQSLAVTSLPVEMFAGAPYTVMQLGGGGMTVMRAEGGGMALGILFVSDFTAQFWKKETDCDGAVSWVRGRSIELDRLLPLDSAKQPPHTIGFAEENNVVFLWTVSGVFIVHLESLQFKKLLETDVVSRYYPLEMVYTADISGGHNGAEVVTHRWWKRWTRHIRQLFS